MARLVTAAMAAALRGKLPIALFADIDHPDGRAYLWTGIGPIDWNGYTFTGAGVLGSVTPVRRTSEVAVQEVTLSLSGVPPETATWLSANVRNRQARLWLGCVAQGKVIPDPFELIDLRVDYQTFSVDDQGIATIALTAQSGFYTLTRALNEVWSDRDQKSRYPNDTGFDLLPGLQNQEVKWTAS